MTMMIWHPRSHTCVIIKCHHVRGCYDVVTIDGAMTVYRSSTPLSVVHGELCLVIHATATLCCPVSLPCLIDGMVVWCGVLRCDAVLPHVSSVSRTGLIPSVWCGLVSSRPLWCMAYVVVRYSAVSSFRWCDTRQDKDGAA